MCARHDVLHLLDHVGGELLALGRAHHLRHLRHLLLERVWVREHLGHLRIRLPERLHHRVVLEVHVLHQRRNVEAALTAHAHFLHRLHRCGHWVCRARGSTQISAAARHVGEHDLLVAHRICSDATRPKLRLGTVQQQRQKHESAMHHWSLGRRACRRADGRADRELVPRAHTPTSRNGKSGGVKKTLGRRESTYRKVHVPTRRHVRSLAVTTTRSHASAIANVHTCAAARGRMQSRSVQQQ
jgi:hypothetical protein